MLTIVVTSLQAVGHLNACAGAMQGLLDRGHRVVIVLSSLYKGKYEPIGYVEHIVRSTESSLVPKMTGTALAKLLIDQKILGPYTPFEKALSSYQLMHAPHVIEHYLEYNQACIEAINLFQPDLFFVDGALPPCVARAGIPWIRCVNKQPLIEFNCPDLPPGDSGLAIDSDPTQWSKWDKVKELALTCSEFNDLFEQHGYPRYSNDKWPESHLFIVYAYPDELNYRQIRDCPQWFNLEVFHSSKPPQSDNPLSGVVPAEFLNSSLDWSGKLIYLSLGSVCGLDLTLMKRLTSVLAQTNHRYIVSKGPRADEYELPPNMYGAAFLPQSRILPLVDLVITHGGNNTVSETFAEGKPMIVLPICRDQFDNAQRLQETGLGVRLDAYEFTCEELISTIDRLLDDKQLNRKLGKASNRIKTLNRHDNLARKIESLLEQKLTKQ